MGGGVVVDILRKLYSMTDVTHGWREWALQKIFKRRKITPSLGIVIIISYNLGIISVGNRQSLNARFVRPSEYSPNSSIKHNEDYTKYIWDLHDEVSQLPSRANSNDDYRVYVITGKNLFQEFQSTCDIVLECNIFDLVKICRNVQGPCANRFILLATRWKEDIKRAQQRTRNFC